MLQIVKKQFAKLSNYPKLRVLLIVVVIIILFIITMNLLSGSHKTPTLPSAVEPAQGVQAAGTASKANTETYQSLANTQDKKDLQQAEETGGTVFQNAFATSGKTTEVADTPPQGDGKAADGSDLSKQVQTLQHQLTTAEQNVNASGQAAPAASSAPTQTDQAAAQADPQKQAAMHAQMQNVMNSMRGSLQSAANGWELPSLATQSASNTGNGGNGSGNTPQGPVAIKAGSILFGVIETSLDSDQPGTPVLATIVAGPYQGARLMGSFSAAKTALVVQFSSMSLPNGNSTFPINAYAIDAKTAQNSVATSVNNHYLLRYGMLFASGFLQGFGNAYNNVTYTCPPGVQNCTTVNSDGTQIQKTSVTTSTAMYQGLGQIGTNLGAAAASVFNTPPTIKVAQGTGIGVLFMSDLRIPLN